MTMEEFKREWVKNFAGDLPASIVELRILCHGFGWNFIWHAFSWKLVPEEEYLEGEAARLAFEEVNKDGAMGINPFDDQPQSVALPEELHSAKAVEDFTEEYYVVGRDFAWTYIQTHEGGLGPYFCRKRTDSAEQYDKAVRSSALKELRLAAKERAVSQRKWKRRLVAAFGVAAGVAVCILMAKAQRQRGSEECAANPNV